MEEYSGYAVSIPLQDRSPQSGRTELGSNLYNSTKWTDPTRVTNLHKSTKWTDPTKGQDQSTKWTDPTKGQDQSTTWTDPTRVKLIQVHKVDGPHQGSNLYKSTKWTDPTKVANLYKSTKWTDPTRSQNYTSPRSGRPHQGSRPHSTKWTDPTMITNTKSTVDEPTNVKTYPQSGRAQPLSTYINQRSGRTLQGVKTNPQNGRTQPGSSLSRVDSN